MKWLSACAGIALFLSLSLRVAAVFAAETPRDVVVAGAEPDETLFFACGDVRCRASVFLPGAATGEASGGPHPVVVMAHGLTMTREYLAWSARRLADSGLAVLTFDYRTFGSSEGSPRSDVSAEAQLEDWRSALRFVASRPDLDATRMGLWGTSFSGGHVLVLASEGVGARAVVAQVPYVGASVEEERGFWFLPKVLGALALDALLRPFGSAFYVDVTGEPGALAGITVPEERAGMERFLESVPESNWQNRMPARVLYRISSYVPALRPEQIACPVLLYVADGDRITPAAPTREFAKRLPQARLQEVGGGHFGIYVEPQRSRVIAEQTAFFREHLMATRLRPDSLP